MERRSGFVCSKLGRFGGAGACLLSLALALSACSSDELGSQGTGSGVTAPGGIGVGAGTGSGATSSIGSGATGGSIVVPSGGGSGGGGGSGNLNLDECATHTEKAELVPVHLVFLMDESASMGDGGMWDPEERWNPVTTALKGFFQDPASAGVDASMILFPNNLNTTDGPASTMIEPDCDAEDYATPVVPLTPLPSPAFGAALDLLYPPNEFGTPTFPALAGTIDYALAQRAADPTRRVVIIMVTDGDPQQCGFGNTVEAAAEEAAAAADEISTYVIGVGNALQSLNAIAEAGGTESALLVAVDDPAQTQADLAAAVAEIRGAAIACDVALPLPPAGETLDLTKVNVIVTSTDGTPTTLSYDQECVTGAGWKYDDAAAPSEIQLCDSTCTEVKADLTVSMDVILGCERNDVVK